MRTYEQFIQQLDEMEYQAPPKPAPKAPIERKAQQPEQRKAPGLADHAAKGASKLRSFTKSPGYQKLKSDSKKNQPAAAAGLAGLVGVSGAALLGGKKKKTYKLGEDRENLDEMEYQAPPKPVEKAPIVRTAQQPETRKAPTAEKKSVPTHATGEIRPGSKSSADHPTDEREQNKKTPSQTRRILGAVAAATKRLKKGKGSVETKKVGPGAKAPKPAIEKSGSTSKSSFKF